MSDSTRHDRAHATFERVLGRPFEPAVSDGQPEVVADLWAVLLEHCFADAWSRPGLEPRIRSLVTIAMLIGLGGAPEEVRSHVAAGLRNGVSKDDVVELLIHAAAYCGVPRTGAAARAALQAMADAT